MSRILADWNQQLAEYQAAVNIATTDERRAALTPPSPDDIAPALWKAIRTRTGTRTEMPQELSKTKAADVRPREVNTYEFDQEWAAPAVIWFINRPEVFARLFGEDTKRMGFFAEALLDSVYRVHYTSPLIAEICPKLAESTSAKVYDIAEKIYNRNTDPTARACAALTLSIMLANPTLSASEGGDARARNKRLYYIRQALHMAPGDAMYGALSLTQAAEEQIYRLRTLTAGTVPPQFKVIAADGKLASFPVQGKPNLIFFWSPGEDVGLSIMSKQRALMTRYPDLVLCPIVQHADIDEWQQTMHEYNVPICYMDDEKGSVGLAYRVQLLPTVILLNERSRILYIGYPDMQLQTALDNYFSKKTEPTAPAAAPRPAVQVPNRTTLQKETPPALRPMPEF